MPGWSKPLQHTTHNVTNIKGTINDFKIAQIHLVHSVFLGLDLKYFYQYRNEEEERGSMYVCSDGMKFISNRSVLI